MTTILFIAILALLILVHETGHFLAAKKQGVKVEEFGFGLPPRIIGRKIGETIYSLNLIPLGGFVKLYGEEYHEVKNKKASSRAFVNKKPFQKMLIIVSGVIGNFLLGWFLISFLFTQGIKIPSNNIVIDKITLNSPAFYAGLKEQDIITGISLYDNTIISIKTSDDFIKEIKKYGDQEIKLLITRDQEKIALVIVPRKNPPKGEGPLGVSIASYTERKYPWYKAPFYGFIESVNITSKIFSELMKILGQVITLQKPKVDVAGPIGIARYAGEAIKYGLNAIVELIALLSFNLAIINIFPFPALDGGRLIFVIYEWLTKKRINPKIERYVNTVGILFLLTLGILISINDVIKILK